MKLRHYFAAAIAASTLALPAAALAGTKASAGAIALRPMAASTVAGPPGHNPDHHNGQGQGNHYGWDKDHKDNGNHNGWYKSRGCN